MFDLGEVWQLIYNRNISMKNNTITFQVWNLSKNNGMNESFTSPFDTHEEETNNERTDCEKENSKK